MGTPLHTPRVAPLHAPRWFPLALAVTAVAAVAAVGLTFTQQARGIVTDLPGGDVVIGPDGSGGGAACAKPCPTATGDLIFLKVDGIPGESTHSHHQDEIVVQSWNWGMEQPGGRGKVDVKDLTVTKEFDKSSPKLMQALASGKHIKEVELKVHREGSNPQDYLTVKLTDVVVSNYAVSQNRGGAATESISFSFSKVQVDYQEQKADGRPGDQEHFGWDLKANKGF